MDISWDTTDILTANSIIFFAVQDSLFPELGWKIYSSTQTGFITLADDFLSATIVDNSFISQGNTYNVSIGIDVDSTEATTGVEFFGGTEWANWNGSTLGLDATIVVTDSVTGFSTPTTPPTIGDTIDDVITTSQSISFNVVYSNGSLEFNPDFIVSIQNVTIDAKDLNVTFASSTLVTFEVLRLVPDTIYTGVTVEANWSQDDTTVVFTDMIDDSERDISTEAAPGKIIIRPRFSGSSTGEGYEQLFVEITASGITNDVTDLNSTNIIVTNPSDPSKTLNINDTANKLDTLTGIHDFYVGPMLGGWADLGTWNIEVISADSTSGEPVILDNVIIDDSDLVTLVPYWETGDVEVSYSSNGEDASTTIATQPTDVTAVTGTQNGELDIGWEIDYPQGITLSQLDFTVQVSNVDPLEDDSAWVDFTDQTSSFGTDMKSATISGLNGPTYSEGVWVQITVGYPDTSQVAIPVVSTIKTIPKQPGNTNPGSGLSTGALIGIIVGSIAGAALIGLGAFFIVKKKNSDDKPSMDKKDEVKKPV